jgi:hypothetical protein
MSLPATVAELVRCFAQRQASGEGFVKRNSAF